MRQKEKCATLKSRNTSNFRIFSLKANLLFNSKIQKKYPKFKISYGTWDTGWTAIVKIDVITAIFYVGKAGL